MTPEEQLDELLARASADWLQPGDVFDVARFAWPSSEDAFVEHAVGLMSLIVLGGLVEPGDVGPTGFRRWTLAPDAAVQRVAEEWRHDHDAAPDSSTVWFRATPEGRERGRRAALVDRPTDD